MSGAKFATSAPMDPLSVKNECSNFADGVSGANGKLIAIGHWQPLAPVHFNGTNGSTRWLQYDPEFASVTGLLSEAGFQIPCNFKLKIFIFRLLV